MPHADVKTRKDVMQFFGDKYGDIVRVVQIGGQAHKLDGYSMELCGGTHTRATGEIGLFRIVSEAAVAAGVRRIEAVAGLSAYDLANQQLQLIRSLAGKLNSPVHELEKKVEDKGEEAERHEGRHHILTLAVTLLHVSIAIATVSIITKGARWPWYAALALGVAGVLTTATAYI